MTKLQVKCSKCGTEIERNRVQDVYTCWDCRQKRNSERVSKAYWKAKKCKKCQILARVKGWGDIHRCVHC